MGILIDEAKCIGCALCENSCAYDAIEVYIKARVDNAKCTDCTVCVDYCPVDAIAMETPLPVRAGPPEEAAFDVVVIGSGMGGLCAGALLAHRGYKTLVLERNPSVGGRFSSLWHKGVMVPTGGQMTQVGRGPIAETFQEAEATFDVVVPERIKYWIRGKGWIDPGPGRGTFRRALILASGDEEAARNVMTSMRDILQSGQYPPGTMLEWLHSITDNQWIEAIFRAVSAAVLGPEDVPNNVFFGTMALTAGTASGLPRGGGIHLMGELAKAIRRDGGEVWTRSKVKSIVVEEGKAAGVLVERRGQPWRVKGRVFISNASHQATVGLVGRENLDPQYLAYLDQAVVPIGLEPGGPCAHILSDRPLLGDAPAYIYLVGTRRIAVLFDGTLIAGWGPPGNHITEVYGFATPPPWTPMDPEVVIQEIAQDLDDVIPGWREFGQLKVFMLHPTKYPGNYTWVGTGASVETPIPNLFVVNDGCKSRAGYAGASAAAESGRWAAELVQERFPLA